MQSFGNVQEKGKGEPFEAEGNYLSPEKERRVTDNGSRVWQHSGCRKKRREKKDIPLTRWRKEKRKAYSCGKKVTP